MFEFNSHLYSLGWRSFYILETELREYVYLPNIEMKLQLANNMKLKLWDYSPLPNRKLETLLSIRVLKWSCIYLKGIL